MSHSVLKTLISWLDQEPESKKCGVQAQTLTSEGPGLQSHPSTTFNKTVTLDRLLILSEPSLPICEMHPHPAPHHCKLLGGYISGHVMIAQCPAHSQGFIHGCWPHL